MKLHEGNIKELARDERAIAKLARIARGDTIHGGARRAGYSRVAALLAKKYGI